tara:strand:+ start:489 stop:704 length:216 start_codon:yes stop_codon:yes gene_type:complete
MAKFKFFSYVVRFKFVFGFPLKGMIASMFGVINGWGWTFLASGALFFGPTLIQIFFVILWEALDKNVDITA